MPELPPAARLALRRLSRRLALGLFLDVWPAWAVGALLAGGGVALACRLFVPAAAPILPWLATVPLAAVLPAAAVCAARRYRASDLLALADSLSGGHGLVLALAERPHASWAGSPLVEGLTGLQLPRLRPWRRLAAVPAAAAFLAAALLLPQRLPAGPGLLADQIADDLSATLVELKAQELVTPEEEKKLEEEIERIRNGARERVDASTWEASDALRERVATNLMSRQDAVEWAHESLARFSAAAAASGGVPAEAVAGIELGELTKALEALERTGLLAGAPQEIRQLAGGQLALPSDAEALRQLIEAISRYLANAEFRLAGVLEGEPGRFDPDEFALADAADDASGIPGAGAVTRGRADADLTRGRETSPHDRFRSQALPPGYVRGPDDWAPAVTLPGAPVVAPERGAAAAARSYQADPGGAAWRRTLAPRHQSAVRKYFEE